MKYFLNTVNEEQFRFKFQVNSFFTCGNTKTGIKEEIWNSKEEEEKIKDMEENLNAVSKGLWKRLGNNFYMELLDDAFWFRMYYDEDIRIITEAEPKEA